jgi:coenzyme F420-reducing hydrogenase delta subunit
MSDSKPVRAPNPAFFDHSMIDNLIAVTMELGAELWVQRERMRVIEQLLSENGVVTREAIERYEASPEERERVRSERDAFVQRLYGLLLRDTVNATPGQG